MTTFPVFPESSSPTKLAKSPTGITGLDAITLGGLPKGRTTLISGGPGCGKTFLAMEYLVNGIQLYAEPGVFISFEENAEELLLNYSSLWGVLEKLVAQNKLRIEYIYVDRNDLEAAGRYDLEALFIRIDEAISQTGAKRVVLDTIEALFSGFTEEMTLRAELRRLFRWLKARGVTTIITGEKGEGILTRHGLEEYVSDCVIFLDHRVTSELSTRRLRIVKYRGSAHGVNEYPFLIDESGISVLPLTSVGLDYVVTGVRVSSGIERLDAMLAGKGYYQGSTILVSGAAGTGKTSLAAQFADAACKRGEKCLYFAFEESASQIVRNMQSIGIDFAASLKAKLITFHTVRPSVYGLEMHLALMHKLIRDVRPDVVVIDPISNMISQGNAEEVKSMLLRLIDYLRQNNVTTLLTMLVSNNTNIEHMQVNVSSIADTWLLLRDIEQNGEFCRGLMIVKSRGMAQSKQIKEFDSTANGLEIVDGEDAIKRVATGS